MYEDKIVVHSTSVGLAQACPNYTCTATTKNDATPTTITKL